jgi:hypothetical protein
LETIHFLAVRGAGSRSFVHFADRGVRDSFLAAAIGLLRHLCARASARVIEL